MKPRSTSFFRNLTITIALAAVVFWLGHESAERGVFKFKRDEQKIGVDPGSPTDAAVVAVPTPTPLPVHFPDVTEDDLSQSTHDLLPLPEAYKTCWPEAPKIEAPPALADFTTTDVEALFGKVKKREKIEAKTEHESADDSRARLGLLFDNSVFSGGAAGSAVEKDGRYFDLHLRAAGRMLRCESVELCECL